MPAKKSTSSKASTAKKPAAKKAVAKPAARKAPAKKAPAKKAPAKKARAKKAPAKKAPVKKAPVKKAPAKKAVAKKAPAKKAPVKKAPVKKAVAKKAPAKKARVKKAPVKKAPAKKAVAKKAPAKKAPAKKAPAKKAVAKKAVAKKAVAKKAVAKKAVAKKAPAKNPVAKRTPARTPVANRTRGRRPAARRGSVPTSSAPPAPKRQAKSKVPFKVGDKVVYPHHGAATIIKKERIEFGGEKQEYFVLEVATDQLTVRVPTVRALDLGVRPVISKAVARRVFATFKDEPQEAGPNWSRWYKLLTEKINSGDIFQVAEVVRDLTYAQQIKGISPALKRMLAKARLIIISELRFALVLEEEEAIKRLDRALPKVEEPVDA